jgi:hypothetical protein
MESNYTKMEPCEECGQDGLENRLEHITRKGEKEPVFVCPTCFDEIEAKENR